MVMAKKYKKVDNKPSGDMIANAIHLVNAFGFKPDSALKMINSGLLGYRVDSKGETVKEDGKAVPLTVSRASYYNYQKKYTDMPEYYKELKSFAMNGYARLAVGFQKELSFLHSMAAEILLSEKENMNKLHAIDILVSKIIPTQSAFADILKEMLIDNPSMMEDNNVEHTES